jgi:hypothetical protein
MMRRKYKRRRAVPSKDVKVRVIPPIDIVEERRLMTRSAKYHRWKSDVKEIRNYYKLQDR